MPLKYQAMRFRFPGSSEVTVMLAVPSAASWVGGPSATPLSPKTTTPAAGPAPEGRSTFAESVTGEQAVAVGSGPAERVMEHAR